MTTPVGWIAAAIIGLIAAGVALYVYWDKVKKVLTIALNKICDAFVKLGDFIMKYTLIGYVINGIKKLVATAVWLYENWDEVMASCGRLWSSLGETINQFFDWFSNLSLFEAGASLITGLWDGLKSVWDTMTQWLSGAVQKLMGWMPDFVKDKLGFNVTVSKNTTESLKNLTQETKTYAQKIIHSTVVSNISPEQRYYTDERYVNGEGRRPYGEAFKTPEPIMAHKENKTTNVDASITISGLNISGGSGSPQDISAAIKKALADQARQQRLAINSSLSD
ncbi:hypothetical protein BWD121_005510 [Bartonella sp. WD12.1]|nr:hypothetical protein BWD121_005510 [Bartonella sp. WD12.1]